MASLEKQNRKDEAEEVKSRFEEAWQWANVELDGSLIAQHSYDAYDNRDLFKSTLAYNEIKVLPNCGVKQ